MNWLPVYLSLRTKKGMEEPEVFFGVLYLTEPEKREILEQAVEIALGPNRAFDSGNVGSLKRMTSHGNVSAIPPPRGSPKPPKEPRTPRVVELLRKAIEWKRLLETGKVPSQDEIAQTEGITRSRVNQILSLLSLTPKIQKYILTMPDSVEIPAVTERSLRPISGIEDPKRQVKELEELTKRT